MDTEKIIKELKKNNKYEIKEFGTFHVEEYKTKRYNPALKREIPLKFKRIFFKPHRKLRMTINNKIKIWAIVN